MRRLTHKRRLTQMSRLPHIYGGCLRSRCYLTREGYLAWWGCLNIGDCLTWEGCLTRVCCVARKDCLTISGSLARQFRARVCGQLVPLLSFLKQEPFGAWILCLRNPRVFFPCLTKLAQIFIDILSTTTGYGPSPATHLLIFIFIL
jgi:hypothetical protein